MSTFISEYLLWQMATDGTVQLTGALAVSSSLQGKIDGLDFVYAEGAQPLDPRHQPEQREFTFKSDGRSFPGFIDDFLPDDWGSKVIAARLKKRFVTKLDLLDNAGIYASLASTKILPPDIIPGPELWGSALDISCLTEISDSVWDGDLTGLDEGHAALQMIVKGGSQPGGARPKLLAGDKSGRSYLVKFNRSADRFNFARMEWACLELCRAAGLPTPAVEVVTLPTGREGLMVERFDVTERNGRYHSLTFNSLLKNPHDQDDPHYASYEDLVTIIQSHSHQPRIDLERLFMQMLVNMCVRNTDDHLRNFSMLRTDRGWELSPVYDIVPNEDLAVEHYLNVAGSPYLPSLDDATRIAKKSFGISIPAASRIIERLRSALELWPDILTRSGMSAADRKFAQRVVSHTVQNSD